MNGDMQMLDNKCPCINCKDRKVTLEFNCHTACPRFVEWKKLDKQRAMREKAATKQLYSWDKWNTIGKY